MLGELHLPRARGTISLFSNLQPSNLMNAQMEIDFSKNVHASDPITSYEAAEMASDFAQSHFNIIFEVLLKHSGGLTSQEISGKCDLGYHQVARRVGEMKKIGLLIRTDETRKTESGAKACVWKIK